MVETLNKDLETLYITEESTPRPEVNPSFPRLYGHPLCPFVEKVRMALAARNVQYQRVELDLDKKTPWHLGINGGLVPIWELPDGTIINESKILMDYIEDAYPTQGYSLLPADPVVRARMRLASALSDASMMTSFPLYLKKKTTEEEAKAIKEKIQKIEHFIAANGKECSPYALGTENPTQLDVHFYTHFVRFEMMENSAFQEIFDHLKISDYPLLKKLTAAIKARPEFRGGVLSPTKGQHQYLVRSAEKPVGEKAQLFLPVANDE